MTTLTASGGESPPGTPAGTVAEPPARLGDEDYGRLADLRSDLRRLLHWIEVEVAEAGLTPAQHHLLLAIRAGAPGERGPTIREVAERLCRHHHTVVELVDRAVEAGLVERHLDATDRRIVRLRLTAAGSSRLVGLARFHAEELARLGTLFGAFARTGPG